MPTTSANQKALEYFTFKLNKIEKFLKHSFYISWENVEFSLAVEISRSLKKTVISKFLLGGREGEFILNLSKGQRRKRNQEKVLGQACQLIRKFLFGKILYEY